MLHSATLRSLVCGARHFLVLRYGNWKPTLLAFGKQAATENATDVFGVRPSSSSGGKAGHIFIEPSQDAAAMATLHDPRPGGPEVISIATRSAAAPSMVAVRPLVRTATGLLRPRRAARSSPTVNVLRVNTVPSTIDGILTWRTNGTSCMIGYRRYSVSASNEW